MGRRANWITTWGASVALVVVMVSERSAQAKDAESNGSIAPEVAGAGQSDLRGLLFDSRIFFDVRARDSDATAGAAEGLEPGNESTKADGWVARLTRVCRMSPRAVAGAHRPSHACGLLLAFLDGKAVSSPSPLPGLARSETAFASPGNKS
jgi:hypothetical protein